MTIGRKVDATPLCRRELGLFCNAHNAWEHFQKHVLDGGESWSWGILIRPLQAVLDAGRRADLYEKARIGSPARVPDELAEIWSRFLQLVAAAAEQGVKRGWYWEEKPKPGDGPYKVFAGSGILTCLDEERLRTGFLPFKGELPPGPQSAKDRCYQLFVECWKKVRFMYQRTQQDNRLVNAPAVLHELMRKVLAQVAWEKLKGG